MAGCGSPEDAGGAARTLAAMMINAPKRAKSRAIWRTKYQVCYVCLLQYGPSPIAAQDRIWEISGELPIQATGLQASDPVPYPRQGFHFRLRCFQCINAQGVTHFPGCGFVQRFFQ